MTCDDPGTPHGPHVVDRGAFGVRRCPGVSADVIDARADHARMTDVAAGLNVTLTRVARERDAARAETERLRAEPSEVETLATELAEERTAHQQTLAELERLRPVVDAATNWVEARGGWMTDDPDRRATEWDLALIAAVDALDADAPVEPAPDEQQYLIWSHHHTMWWGPGGRGYRMHIADAGRYALADTAQWLGRGCGCCPVPEVIIPAPPGASIDLIRYGQRQIKKATAELIGAGQVNRYADGGDPR